MLRLSDERVLAEFDEVTGAMVRLADLKRGVEFLDVGKRSVALRTVREAEFSSSVAEFEYAQPAPGALHLTWTVAASVRISGTVALLSADQAPGLEFTVAVDVGPDARVDAVEFPVLGTLTSIGGDPRASELAHSYATGFLVRDPLANFREPGSGLRLMPYPEGFAGATAQLMAYYAAGIGGLLVTCRDAAYAPKWLNFFKGENGLLEATVMHGNEALAEGASFRTAYATRVELLAEGSWYEAADRYKSWATSQSWCSSGWAADRGADLAIRRLCDTAGAATFGLDARFDRSRWIRRYRESMKTRMLHVLGPDWPRIPRGYGRPVAPGEIDEWFPAEFSAANMEAIREAGDLVTPFEFDYLFPPEKAKGRPEIASAFQQIPQRYLSHGEYSFPFLCPTEKFTRSLHVERDARLVAEERVDGAYYDISANNILRTCVATDHAHAPGGAATLTRAYRESYSATRAAMTERGGRDPLLGTEMVNEVFLDLIDFYQARAGAQPAAAFEGGPLRELLKRGEAELIPLFAYLYHEYGAVRLDGWGKLTEEVGDLFFYNVSRIYLWGGLFEINAEFSPSEVVDGVENPPEEHYATIVPRGYRFSKRRAAFVRAWAALRVGQGRDFLAYGQMKSPPAVTVKDGPQTVGLDWFSYNCPQEWKEYEDKGELTVPSVVVSAWRSRAGRIAWFVVNVAAEAVLVELTVVPAQHGWVDDVWWRARVSAGSPGAGPARGPAIPGDGRGIGRLRLRLEPRVPTMVSFTLPEEENS